MSVWHWAFLALIVSIVSAIFRAVRRRSAADPRSMVNASGWLALLIASLGVIAPLANVATLDASLNAAEALHPGLATVATWGTYKTACWSAVLLASLLAAYAALDLGLSRNVRAVTAAVIAVWIIGPALSVGLSLVIPALVFGQVQVTSSDVLRVIVSAGIAAAWTAYLLKSVRVKVRYVDGLLPDPRGA